MPRRPFAQFLLSGAAIQVHVLCVGLIVLLSVSLWTGEAQPDYVWGLVFAVVVYPVLLALLWYSDRLDEKIAAEHAIESLTAPAKLLRKRRRWRVGSLAFFFAVAVWLIYSGCLQGLRIDFIPAQYIGYFCLAVAIFGAAGVNIWYGGPLDTRADPQIPDDVMDVDEMES